MASSRLFVKHISFDMVEKAPIVKEYKRAGSFFGAKGTRVLRLLTTILTLGLAYVFCLLSGAGFYCLMYVPFDDSHGPNVFTPVVLISDSITYRFENGTLQREMSSLEYLLQLKPLRRRLDVKNKCCIFICTVCSQSTILFT